MSLAAWTACLSPPQLVRASVYLTEQSFSQAYGATPILAIGVPPGQDAIAAGLELVLGGAGMEAAAKDLGRDLHTSVMEQRAAKGSPAQVDLPSLARRLASGHRHLVRVAKRPSSTAGFANRVSLGRALSADIILRHSSISKFHAFIGAEDGVWHLVDGESKNGTLLNGARLAGRQREALTIGDQIAFGTIDSLFLDAGTLWRVLRTAR
ncbi:MAG: hypothetical protein RL033_7424 [Pseudomonadota bacterium]|jgi:hypothetical protein